MGIIETFELKRYATPVIGLLCCLLVFMVGRSLKIDDILDRMEQVLLDFRLMARSELLQPSKDIVIIGLDQRTENEARAQPEFGLKNRMLPRNRLAEVIRFLNREGARAIVLDIELKTLRDPQEDEPLHQAIAGTHNVYLATFMDLPLKEFEQRQAEKNAWEKAQDTSQAIQTYVLEPLLDDQLLRYVWQRWLLSNPSPMRSPGSTSSKTVSSVAQIPPPLWNPLLGPFFPPLDDALPQPPAEPSSLRFNLENAPNGYSWQTGSAQRLHGLWFRFGQPRSGVYLSGQTSFLPRFYEDYCLHWGYQKVFQQRLSLLEAMTPHRLNHLLTQVIPNPLARASSYCSVNPLEPFFMNPAQGVGMTAVSYDSIAMIREIPLLYRGQQGDWFSYLGLRPVLDLLQVRGMGYQNGGLQIQTDVHQWHIPLNEDGRLMINWRSPKRLIDDIYRQTGMPPRKQLETGKAHWELGFGHLYRQVSVIDVLRYLEAPQQVERYPSLFRLYDHPDSGRLSFRNKIVVYGDTVKDLHRTPVGNTIYGPEVVATTIDMLLNDRIFVHRAPSWLSLGIVFLLAAAIVSIQLRTSTLPLGFLGGLLLLLLYWVLAFGLFLHNGLWLSLARPSALLLGSLMLGSLYRYSVLDVEKRQLAHVFSKYVSPQLMDQIVANPRQALDKLRGSRQELTVLFADIHNFTQTFENESAEVMVQQLNEFFNVMMNVILKHQGTYDKYLGDGLMAFFGAPAHQPDHVARACHAALEMQQALTTLNQHWAAQGQKVLKIGVGLSTGPVYVGNFGADQIKNFTVMGLTVNLGARLETYTRQANVGIVVSQRTQELAGKHFVFADLGVVDVKGFTQPVQAFSLERLASSPAAGTERLEPAAER
ncbi:MAG: adenylate/guanylate cyclase domain-containing protein [Candidatus Melainabacteria bacterium]|nr:adenylate/guanylate cyclase domain-containing protein [Candidatus Melainabacteria bacterium]